jgi:hypothetical protein
VLAAEAGTRIAGGTGQGILAVPGALELAGDATFHGIVAADGPVTLRDRAQVLGTIVSRIGVTVSDAASAGRSVCAVARALAGAARASPRLDRRWMLWP